MSVGVRLRPGASLRWEGYGGILEMDVGIVMDPTADVQLSPGMAISGSRTDAIRVLEPQATSKPELKFRGWNRMGKR